MTAAKPPTLESTYTQLPAICFTRQHAEASPAPKMLLSNPQLADRLGIAPDWLASEQALAVLAGNEVIAGSDPIASVYAGHQFGSWNPQLGDGRALLLGEIVAPDGARFDIQLKGSGRTPYSRGGDGKAPLGPVLREYLISEAMDALGVPTTRSLAAVLTGETVYRDSALPGAILTRVASSHIRIGTLQFFAARNDIETLSAVVDYSIARHYPAAAASEIPALALLQAVVAAQAALVAQWQLLGFIHGVMNTDNMLLCGETIDYGPCAFMDGYDPATVFSSIDHGGRYAYGNQPGIAHWNLAMLAQALLPLFDKDPDTAVALAQPVVDGFGSAFVSAWRRGIGRKLGIGDLVEADDELVQELLALMESETSDFTLCFRRLAEIAGDQPPPVSVQPYFDFNPKWDAWLARWRKRLDENTPAAERQADMLQTNPAIIPRNHRVEAALTAAIDEDMAPLHKLQAVLSRPFAPHPEDLEWAAPPGPEQGIHRTFCGT